MVCDLPSNLVLASLSAWQRVLQLGPYVAGGILLAVLLRRLDLPRVLGQWLRHRGPAMVLGGAFLGGISPLCTHGTVPVLLELLRGGAPPGPALAFLVSSSMLNPQLLLLVAGGLGPRLALSQVAGVLLLSLPVGLLAQRLGPASYLRLELAHIPESDCAHQPVPAGRAGAGQLLTDLLDMTGLVGLTFVIGVILASLVQTLVPATWVAALLGGGRWYGVLLTGIVGVPFYTCGGGAVPVLAELLAQGMRPGAALAFFLVGPATRLTSLAALGTVLNRRALLAYVGYIWAGSVLLGLLLG